MSTVEIDLKKLGSLQDEIKILESRKEEIVRDAEKIREETIKFKRESDQKIAKEKEDFEIYKHGIEQGFRKREEDIAKKEEELKLREQSSKDLDIKIEEVNAKLNTLSTERKILDELKSNYLDREHKANLLIEQYEKRIGELPPEPEEVKKKTKKIKE